MRIRLGELLVQHGVLTSDQLQTALDTQSRGQPRRKLGEVVIALGLASDTSIQAVLSKALGIPNVNLDHEHPLADALKLVSLEEALRSLILPLRIMVITGRQTLLLAMADPTNLNVIDLLQFRLGMTVKPMLSTVNQLRSAIIDAYRRPSAVGHAKSVTITEIAVETPPADVSVESTWIGPSPKTVDVAELKIIAGPGKGRTLRMAREQTLVFGRSPDSDVVIPDMRLSRRHFALTHQDGKLSVADLQSSNGTVVNGARIERQPVANGDEIRAGATALTIQIL